MEGQPRTETSIPGLLRDRATRHGDATAYTFMDGVVLGTGHPETLKWAQLYRRSSALAEELRRVGSTGDRAAIVAPQGLDYIVAFFGALQAGFVAVPLPVPQAGAPDRRVAAAIEDSAPVVLLTTSEAVADVNKYANPARGGPTPEVIEVDTLDTAVTRTFDTIDHSRPGPAYLQYTSGSTRTPVGAIVSHHNIAHNVQQIIADYFTDVAQLPDSTFVSWLPFYHDMGLMLGVTAPLMAQSSVVFTSPLAFLSRPASWLQLMASHSGTFSAAPNFALDLAVRCVADDDMAGLDLGNMVALIVGAERVNCAALKRFTWKFGQFGLRKDVVRPAYGLAEATLHVATPALGRPVQTARFDREKLREGVAQPGADGREGTTELVSYGAPLTSVIRIVDPDTAIERAAGSVGEIWVHGDNVALGYWRKPEQTERTFCARISTPTEGTPAGPWLRTGDLGVISDGQLFVIGRLKDLIIVDGCNHYPDDIEATVQEVTGRRVAAIGIEDGPTDQVVLIVELKEGGSAEETTDRVNSAKHDVARAVWECHKVGIGDLLVVAPGSIPITTSGKVRRSSCAELYRNGGFRRLDVAP